MNNEEEQKKKQKEESGNSNANPKDGVPNKVEKDESVIEKAERIRDEMIASEKRSGEKIDIFEKKLAESILSGRAQIVPTKTQVEKDKETADDIVNTYMG